MKLSGSFGEGLFNSFSKKNLKKWTAIVEEGYPEFKGLYKLFGYDWLGRCFGVDLRKNTYGNILMFEIGSKAIFEIPCSLDDFLNKEIPLHADACLEKDLFIKWRELSNLDIKYERCIGYKTPLFLNGKHDLSNLEDSDMEVYWSILSQIKNQI